MPRSLLSFTLDGEIVGRLFQCVFKNRRGNRKKTKATRTVFFFEAGQGLWRWLVGVKREMNVSIFWEFTFMYFYIYLWFVVFFKRFNKWLMPATA